MSRLHRGYEGSFRFYVTDKDASGGAFVTWRTNEGDWFVMYASDADDPMNSDGGVIFSEYAATLYDARKLIADKRREGYGVKV